MHSDVIRDPQHLPRVLNKVLGVRVCLEACGWKNVSPGYFLLYHVN